MADIKVVIQLQDTAEDEITDLGSSSEVNNASIQKTNGSFGSLSTKSDGTNMKSWANGSLSLADGYVGGADTKLIEQYGYNGYVFGAVPESKELTVTLEVRGENVDSIIIYGDTSANQFPTKAYRDGNPNDIIYSDDATWAIKFDTVASSHTITFLEWNRANYNACITYVAELKKELEFDKSWIKSVESLSQSTGQPNDIYYGIVPNSGRLELLDRNLELHDYITDNIIEKTNVELGLKVNNRLVQEHISVNSEYSKDGILSIEMSNYLKDFDKLYYGGYSYKKESASLYVIIVDAISKLISKYSSKIVLSDEFVSKTTAILYQTPFVPYMSYKDFFNKVCAITQSQFVQKDDGYFYFLDATNHTYKSKDAIVIPSKFIISGTDRRDIILKNKQERVEYRNSLFIRDTNKAIESNTFDIEVNYDELVTQKVSAFNSYESSLSLNRQGVRLETIVRNGSFTIKKTPSIERIFSAEINIDKTLSYSSKDSYFDIPESSLYNNSLSVDKQKEKWRDYEKSFDGNYLYVVFPSNSTKELTGTSINYIDISDSQSKSLSLNHTNSVTITENDNEYIVNYSILVFTGKYYIYSINGAINKESTESVLLEIDRVKQFTITVKGEYSTIEFSDNIEFIGNLESSNFITLEDNELNQKGVLYKNTPIYSYVANNILSNYKNGLSTANASICCADLYNTNGELIKNWSNGQIVEIGDVVRLDKDNNGNSLWSYKDGTPMYWKVTGRNFRKVGVPMIDLELQEVRVV